MSVPRRFFVDPARIGDPEVELEGEELRHARVLRLELGESVEVLDGYGRARTARVIETESGIRFAVEAEAPSREPSVAIELAVGLLDSDRIDDVIRAGTELGMAVFVPLVTERVRGGLARGAEKRVERWRRIAREAVKQCGRARIPEIVAPCSLDAALMRPANQRWLFDPDASRDDGQLRIASSPQLLIGPEGGWSIAERQQLVAAGAVVVGLGARVLRTETAALAALMLAGRG